MSLRDAAADVVRFLDATGILRDGPSDVEPECVTALRTALASEEDAGARAGRACPACGCVGQRGCGSPCPCHLLDAPAPAAPTREEDAGAREADRGQHYCTIRGGWQPGSIEECSDCQPRIIALSAPAAAPSTTGTERCLCSFAAEAGSDYSIPGPHHDRRCACYAAAPAPEERCAEPGCGLSREAFVHLTIYGGHGFRPRAPEET